ncbi:type II and III secretion system protein family protein [Aromatoleum aromaticum]|uniref:type II and III secretion system protein family protein n=1 Tax=Aromatoleum aromaticum TaxID=551760 RepID=UPI00145991DD|nr:type II and III secretion system protein family protein [Aromatoleum aromaticum]NMG56795.1 type II and III secretion system protein family protein [Aromatoleum aromaticum]
MSTKNLYKPHRSIRAGASIALALLLPVATQAAIGASTAPRVAVATTNGSPCGRVEIAPMVTIPVGKSSVIRPEVPVTRILLGNPDNAQAARPSTEPAKDDKGGQQAKQSDGRPGVAQVDVLLLSPNEIYLLGKSVGSTNVVLVDRSGGCTALDVTVAMDVTSVQGVLATLLPDEKDINVSSAYDSLVLTGMVSDATVVDRAVEIAAAYVGGAGENGRNTRVLNMLNVGAPQQVMLEVKVAEISKTLMEKLGMKVVATDVTGGGVTYTLLSDFLSGGAGIVDLFKLSSGDSITLDAQKDDGLIKVLAEPNVMAISGQEGSFLSGGKIFIPVAQTNENGFTKITLEEKEFGIALKFTPTVLAGGRINLKVAPEVSELNRDGIGISAPGVNGAAILPSFTTRRAATTVQLHDGQSFAIGGLIKNNTTTNIHAFPFLGEIPVIGALFRSTEFQTDRSELVFVITPRLVKPLPENYALPTDNYVEPTRADVMWRGKVEGTRPAAADHPDMLPGAINDGRGGFEPK